jgi:hypothetical protein
MKGVFFFIIYLPRNFFCGLIKVYQKTISPDHGLFKVFFAPGYCKFQPTCSVYCYDTLKKHGVIKGLPLSIWRILRCNPWNKGGEDLVKKKIVFINKRK